jgi:hypothetical protein
VASPGEYNSETLLPAFMDRHLSDIPSPQRLSSEHGQGALIAEAFHDSEAADSFIAAFAWAAALENRQQLSYALRWQQRFPSVSETSDCLVVRHADGRSYSLLVLDPTHSGPSVATRVDGGDLSDIVTRNRYFSNQLDSLEIKAGTNLYRHGVLISPDGLLQAAREFYDDQGCIVIARQPELIPTALPAMVVEDSLSGSAEATVGTVAVSQEHGRVGTTALHAVKDIPAISIADSPTNILACHEPTDSCIVSLSNIPWEVWSKYEWAPLELSPRLYSPAQFTGAAREDQISTMITAVDPSLAIPQTMFATKIYTNPDTLPGDSGAALTDDLGRVIGFAAWRTGFGAEISFAIWIWAQQVFAAHNLRLPR